MNDPKPPSIVADRANTFPWPPLLFAVALGSAFVLEKVAPLSWPGVDDLPARIIGWTFGAVGVSLIAWAILTLHRAGTTVMPDKTTTVLVTSGPFARFRNPIYLGEVLILLAMAELTKNIWFVAAAAAFGLLVTVLQITFEERHLEARFGERYRAYKATARRWI